MASWNVTAARAALADILELVASGEEVELTRHGHPVAVIVRPDRLRARRAGDALLESTRLRARLEQARDGVGTAGQLTPERAEELIAELRRDRDRR